ncbi:MAG: HU family DNA-binding protein [Desulfobacterales bacterium]
MTSEELNRLLAEKEGISQKSAKQVVDAIFHCMAESLCREDRIDIRGFGSFRIKHYAGYRGRNPKTGEPVEVKPKKLPCFRVGKSLRDRVNRGGESVRETRYRG